MNKNHKQNPISFEEAKKLFESHDHESAVTSVRSSIWRAHWSNARTASSSTQLTNLLANHKRLYNGEPSGSGFIDTPDHSAERSEIIAFIEARLQNEFGIIPPVSEPVRPSLDDKIQSASSRTTASQPNHCAKAKELEPEI